MRVLGQYAVVYLVNGSGHYRDAQGTRVRVQAGTVLLLFPELAHHYGPGRGEVWDEGYVCFDGGLFDACRADGLFDPSRPVHQPGVVPELYRELETLCTDARPTTTQSHLAQLSRLMALLAKLLSFPAVTGEGPEWLRRARALLEADLGQPLSGQDVAASVGLGYDSFRKNFAIETGYSPGQYRDLKRLEAAKTLLGTTQLTHAAIARSLGFRDEFHFSKRFKTELGVGPREFRNRR